ncbi:MAG: DUF6457 domain-containing protein [Arachnia sp.]
MIEAEAWQEWIGCVADALGEAPEAVDVAAIHALGREVARGFTRPMAPVSAYLWGLAVASHPETDPGELRDRILTCLP